MLDNNKIKEYMTLSNKEIQENINLLDEKLDVFWNDDSLDWQGYLNATEDIRKNRSEYIIAKTMNLTENEYRKIYDLQDWELEDCKVPLDTFIEWCELGYVTTNDGEGYYATEDYRTDICASPYHIRNGYIRKDFPYVFWYNK